MKETKFTRNPDLVAAHVDDDLVMMSVENGKYFSINSLGSRIWKLLDNQVSADQITDAICDEYEVSEAICRADVDAFLEQLLKLGLVKSA